jgi:hypothetical protein
VDAGGVPGLAESGLTPSESNPQFHQQMAYVVAMRTIERFERALGRKALWTRRQPKKKGEAVSDDGFVRKLRIYPHALREANAYYDPDKVALLFGYFLADDERPGDNAPGQPIFSCPSHDIVAHEMTHAVTHRLRRYFLHPSNEDVLAFHEGFADVVALFQHFSMPGLTRQIRRLRDRRPTSEEGSGNSRSNSERRRACMAPCGVVGGRIPVPVLNDDAGTHKRGRFSSLRSLRS